MGKEFKAYALKATRKPARWDILSTTVAVFPAAKEQCYCYVSFSRKLVEAVGKKLPHGVSSDNPAYLVVTQDTLVPDRWHVYARYVKSAIIERLWTTDTCPTWLNFFKVKTDGYPEEEKDGLAVIARTPTCQSASQRGGSQESTPPTRRPE